MLTGAATVGSTAAVLREQRDNTERDQQKRQHLRRKLDGPRS